MHKEQFQTTKVLLAITKIYTFYIISSKYMLIIVYYTYICSTSLRGLHLVTSEYLLYIDIHYIDV